VNSKLLAIAGVVVVLVGVAVVNSQRADRARKDARPAPSPTVAAPVQDPTDFVCQSWGSRDISQEASAVFSADPYRNLVVTSVRCTDARGRHASLVQIRDIADDARIVATLIRPAQVLHVASLSTDATVVTVAASEAAASRMGDQKAASDLGSVFAWRFTYSAGGVTAADRERVAFACSPVDVRMQVTQKSEKSGPSGSLSGARVRFTNKSKGPCALEGYPLITGISAQGETLTAHQQLFGPTGGELRAGAPAVMVLRPGQTTTAAVDSAQLTPAGGASLCSNLSRLKVGLPTGEPVGTASVQLRVCDFQVHPLVLGSTGNDA
jgi:hypothetical protein